MSVCVCVQMSTYGHRLKYCALDWSDQFIVIVVIGIVCMLLLLLLVISFENIKFISFNFRCQGQRVSAMQYWDNVLSFLSSATLSANSLSSIPFRVCFLIKILTPIFRRHNSSYPLSLSIFFSLSRRFWQFMRWHCAAQLQPLPHFLHRPCVNPCPMAIPSVCWCLYVWHHVRLTHISRIHDAPKFDSAERVHMLSPCTQNLWGHFGTTQRMT